MKFIRGDADIRVRFKNSVTVGSIPAYQPGDLLEASLEIYGENPINCRDVEVSIGWHTEGKGDRNNGRAYLEPLGVTQIEPGIPVAHNVSFRLPSTPWSYEGELIQVVWAVNVKIDIAMMPDINSAHPFVLQP